MKIVKRDDLRVGQHGNIVGARDYGQRFINNYCSVMKNPVTLELFLVNHDRNEIYPTKELSEAFELRLC